MKQILSISSFIGILTGQVFIPFESMTGCWEGFGYEIVNWSDADSIFFSIYIESDGKVWGTVGDAKLVNGILQKNHWITRKLGNPEYLIGGKLEGMIVEKEQIKRKALKYLILDFMGDRWEGGFHTSSTFTHPWAGKAHWKKHMRMTGVHVLLKKCQN